MPEKCGNKELFYIMSRGFSEKQAMKLLVEKINYEEIKNEILYEIDNKLE